MKKISTKNKRTKLISALLIISIITPAILFSEPKYAKAVDPVSVPTQDIVTETWTGVSQTIDGKNWLVYLGEKLLKLAAKRLLAEMTQKTINWINSDFHGSPLFLENPDSFFKDIEKSILKDTVTIFGYDNVTYPFGKQFSLNAINSYKRQLGDNARYTLRNVMNSAELRIYQNNFNYGGWNGFLMNTQYPQNNYLGFTILASDTVSGKLQGISQSAAQKTQSLLQQGMGFLSPQTCPSNPGYNNGTNEFQRPSFQYNVPYTCTQEVGPEMFSICDNDWVRRRDEAKAEWTKKNTCPGGLVNTTPGSVAANQVFSATNTPFLQTALDGALGNSLAAIFDALIDHFIEKGLNAMTDTSNPEPKKDNWSYDGITLNGGTVTTGNNTEARVLNIPQNVSVYTEETTSTAIYGGIENYSIQHQPNKSIATATIDTFGSSGAKLKIVGIAPGTTSVTVQDSSSPAQTVTVTITVNAVGDLVVIPASISTIPNSNDPIIATISGGEEPYKIKTASDTNIAITDVIGTNLFVSSRLDGETFVDIVDSSIPAKTTRVNIVVKPEILTIDPQNVSVDIGQVSNIPISNGKPPYLITSVENINVIKAEILSSSIMVTGLIAGTSSVSVQDSSYPAKIASVKIVVKPDILTITPAPASINIDDVASISISKGTAPYTFTNQNINIATAKIIPATPAIPATSDTPATPAVPATLVITGIAKGTTSITIQDSSTPAQTITINIEVVEDINNN